MHTVKSIIFDTKEYLTTLPKQLQNYLPKVSGARQRHTYINLHI